MKKKRDVSPASAPNEPSRTTSEDSSEAAPALMLVRPIAVLAVLAVLLGRAFGSSLRGLAVGLGKLGERVELLGGAMSQCFLMLGTVVSLALVMGTLRAKTSSFVRFVSIMFGGLVTLATLSASATKLPSASVTLSGALACALVLVAAWDTYATPFARATSLVLGFVGLGGAARVAAIALLAQDKVTAAHRTIAQSTLTLSVLLDVLAMLVAIGFVASRNRKTSSPATLIAVGVALVATRLAMSGGSEDPGAVSVLLYRAALALSMRPEPFLANGILTFFAFVAPCLAIAVLVTPTLSPALSGAIALVLLAHGSPDVPLCALMMVIAAVSTILASRDHRGIWAQIKRADDRSAEDSGAAPGSDSNGG